MKVHECERCGDSSDGLHSCPYEEDVNLNFDAEFCSCCTECTKICAGESE